MAVTTDRKLVAVARENNSIEIWLRESWVQLLVIPGNKNCAIRNVHWLEKTSSQSSTRGGSVNDNNVLYTADGQPRRLLTTGLNGVIIEWDLLSHGVKVKH